MCRICILMLLCFATQVHGMVADSSINVWLETSLKRIFPQAPAGSATELELLAALYSYEDFPKTEDWVQQALRKILK